MTIKMPTNEIKVKMRCLVFNGFLIKIKKYIILNSLNKADNNRGSIKEGTSSSIRNKLKWAKKHGYAKSTPENSFNHNYKDYNMS